jgi:hypothetical protein
MIVEGNCLKADTTIVGYLSFFYKVKKMFLEVHMQLPKNVTVSKVLSDRFALR